MTIEMKPMPADLLNGWNIIIIDDEPDAVEISKILLEMHGAQVMTATTGTKGLAMIPTYHPRFILCDISMPEMSGWEVVERLKGDTATASIPVVALTAHAMAGDLEKVLGGGFDNYLTKPLCPETFVSELLTLLVNDFPELQQALR